MDFTLQEGDCLCSPDEMRISNYQVAVDSLAPSQQIPVDVSHKSSESVTSPKKDRKGFLLGDPFGGI
jgi:hypothetical protein